MREKEREEQKKTLLEESDADSGQEYKQTTSIGYLQNRKGIDPWPGKDGPVGRDTK